MKLETKYNFVELLVNLHYKKEGQELILQRIIILEYMNSMAMIFLSNDSKESRSHILCRCFLYKHFNSIQTDSLYQASI